jgi:hypothetical protein
MLFIIGDKWNCVKMHVFQAHYYLQLQEEKWTDWLTDWLTGWLAGCWLLLALASTMVLGSDSRRTHDQILLWQLWESSVLATMRRVVLLGILFIWYYYDTFVTAQFWSNIFIICICAFVALSSWNKHDTVFFFFFFYVLLIMPLLIQFAIIPWR